jgi:threonyl-tRNA synthetase
VPTSGVSQDDFKDLDSLFSKATKEKQRFERLVVSKEEALQLFKYNPFK